MSSNYFPMVSASPPPLDDGPAIEDDDEFGTFTSAGLSMSDDTIRSVVTDRKNSVCSNGRKEVIQNHVSENDTKGNLGNGVKCALRCDEEEEEDDFSEFKAHCESPTVVNARTETKESTANSGKDSIIHSGEVLPTSDVSYAPNGEVLPESILSNDGAAVQSRNADSDVEGSSPNITSKPATLEHVTEFQDTVLRTEQMDNISQDSVTDSGMCTSSQMSEVSVNHRHDDSFGDCEGEHQSRCFAAVKCPNEDDEGLRTKATDGVDDNNENCEASDLDASWEKCADVVGADPLEDDDDDDDDFEAFQQAETDDSIVGQEGAVSSCKSNNHSNLASAIQTDNISECKTAVKDEVVYCSPASSLTETDSRLSDGAEGTLTDSADDVFADFRKATFDSAPSDLQGMWSSSSEPPVLKPPECRPTDSDCSDFGNFASFGEDADQASSESSGFNAFQTATMTSGDDDDDDFGNFDSAAQSTSEFDFEKSSSSSGVIDETLKIAFPKSATSSLVSTIDDLEDALKRSPFQANSKSSKTVWKQLDDIDNTPALTYHWSTSQANKKLLRSLRIHSRNLLEGTRWSSSIPLFAATLGLDPLEPTKAPQKGSEEEVSVPFHAKESTVPPAQFDWSSSGLVNPLDGLESEFLGGEPLQPPRHAVNNPLPSLVDKILSEAAKSSASTFPQVRRRSTHLSAEARQVLDALPDLSFLQAKVLMFPIRENLS